MNQRAVTAPAALQNVKTRSDSAALLKVCAAAGVGLCSFDAYVLAKWVTGPNFVRVTWGPDAPPAWMKLLIIALQVGFSGAGAYLLYRFLIRPWWRDRHLSFDGLVCLGGLCVSMYDAAFCYFKTWGTYNAYFINRGNPEVEIPGWQSFHAPGAQHAWPIFWIPGTYVVLFLVAAWAGCLLLQTVRTRWPRLSNVSIVVICFGAMLLFDLAFEGPLQNSQIYYQTGAWPRIIGNPVDNCVLVALGFTGLACLRFFRNDRGESVVERGATALDRYAAILRLFAVVGAVQLIWLGGYQIPRAFTSKAGNYRWPRLMQQKSYLNSHICGSGTDRACPGSPGGVR